MEARKTDPAIPCVSRILSVSNIISAGMKWTKYIRFINTTNQETKTSKQHTTPLKNTEQTSKKPNNSTQQSHTEGQHIWTMLTNRKSQSASLKNTTNLINNNRQKKQIQWNHHRHTNKDQKTPQQKTRKDTQHADKCDQQKNTHTYTPTEKMI